jgi:hypothetical protein
VRALLVLALSAGCAVADERPGYLRLTGDVTDEVVAGASAWSEIGFTAGTEDQADTVRVVTIHRVANLYETPHCAETGCFWAYAEPATGDVYIDAGATGDRLVHLAAHEVGHVIGLVHVPTVDAVMHGYGTSWVIEPTGADLSMACDVAGYCR